MLAIVDSHAFWVEGYFEETPIAPSADGDPAGVWLIGFPREIKGHVDSLPRAINVPNAQSTAAGIADAPFPASALATSRVWRQARQ